MNILNKVTWKAMWKNKTRTIVTIVGIILSAAMFTAVTTMGISLWDFLVRGEVYDNGDYFVRYDHISGEDVAELRENGKVTRLADYQVLGFLETREDFTDISTTFILAAGDQTFFDTMPVHLLEGRLPESSGEIVLPEYILNDLEAYGQKTGIGDTITMELSTLCADYSSGVEVDQEDAPFTKAYTIVGYIEDSVYGDYGLSLSSMLTLADGGQGEALWHRAFIKSSPSDALKLFQEEQGVSKSLNTMLLGLYGVTQYSNYNQVLMAWAVVLSIIIMIGSVSLIYNAFCICVSERTKQFGLLASVGATRKQIRSAVFAEAMLLSAIGIPLGLISGYGGIAITLRLLASQIDTMFSQGNGTITLNAVLSPAALIPAAVVALVTVLISAAVPAGRATKISPMEAIRQKNDYLTPKKNVKLGKLTYKLFGLPGALAKKYYKVSRKKYRTTVISLIISFVLFVSAACFSQTLRDTVDNTMQTQNYDISCQKDDEAHEQLRRQDFVTKAAYVAKDFYMALTPDSQLSDDFLGYWDELERTYSNVHRNISDIRIFYLEDAVLEEYLKEQGISPEPYFDRDDPMALVCTKKFTTHWIRGEDGEMTRYTYVYDQFAADAERLQLFEFGVPSALELSQTYDDGNCLMDYDTGENGELLMVLTPITPGADGTPRRNDDQAVTYLIRLDSGVSGKTTASYHLYDPETGEASAEAAATQTVEVPRFRLGAAIDVMPYGISAGAVGDYYYTSLILPLSCAPQQVRQNACVNFSVSDYSAAREYMDRNFEQAQYIDYRSNEEHSRTLLLVINVFSYGFIVLISLICVANVFNTISTNVALRRRDFGMLRSTGFREKDLLRMMNFECMTYGVKSLLWSVPISLVISGLIHRIDSGTYTAGYTPPLMAMAIAALSVLIVVFATMFYAVSRLRKDNPIDAIRMENL